MKHIIILVLALAGLLAALLVINSSVAFHTNGELTVEEVLQNYSKWRKVDGPLEVDANLWGLCRAPSNYEIALMQSFHMGEQHFIVNVYVNDIGAKAMLEERWRIFPAGSVIVKEKMTFQYIDGEEHLTQEDYFKKREYSVEALGIMIKRGVGFNPEGDDWEFLYWSKDDNKLYSGAELPHCQSCHMAEAEGDSVFWPKASQAEYSMEDSLLFP